ncbi:uncharacterized protein KGF55_002225 [Candida pseudojiufengensis]|uniref:uncharacterized protein n=1 Tax=Candida pseudojiufengensis TaxID=497109 RepID=UPI0022255C9D|nr:uncharacterized protein KGF55_002225 [Candida pseudojiufengensis]KAI5964283.1 hypothetical protein KGF55_002225 [Candida pseudojiufengensis]
MQGSYNNNGLPRPYYMKPSSKRKHSSPYDNLKEPIIFFNSPKRKLFGYIFMFGIFSLLMYWVSQDLKEKPEIFYELAPSDDNTNDNNNLNNIDSKINSNNNRNSDLNDKYNKENKNLNNIVDPSINTNNKDDSKNLDLAGNLALGSNGKKGVGIVEAPKGGIANEGHIVGNNEEELIGSGKSKPKAMKNYKIDNKDKDNINDNNGGSENGKTPHEMVQQILEDTQ